MLADENAAETLQPPEPARRRAYWPVALLLGGLVLAMLGAAFVLDQEFRPRVGVEPASVSEVAAQPAAVAPAIANVPAAVPTIASAPAAVPVATAAPAAAAPLTLAPTTVPTTAPPTSPVAAAAVTSPLPKNPADLLSPLEKEIVDAYLRYWAVRGQAYYDLDTTRLGEVMAGAELAREEAGVQELKAQGRGADLDVEHNFRILKATPEEAVVYDEYLNHSVFIDAATKQVIPTKEPPAVLKVSFEFRKVQGVWKVVDGTHHQ